MTNSIADEDFQADSESDVAEEYDENPELSSDSDTEEGNQRPTKRSKSK